jgi:hypothetical protein
VGIPKDPLYAKNSNILLILKFSRTLGYLRISFLGVKCDDIPVTICLQKYFLMDPFALSIFYFIKTIGNNDSVVGKMSLPAIPLFLLNFIAILYPISHRPNVGTKSDAIYAADSNISMILYWLPLNHQVHSV